jgi:hypothetical protein
MMKAPKVFLCFLIVSCQVLLACSLALHFFDFTSDQEKWRLERQIEKDLPIGSSKADVANWFAAHGYQPHTGVSGDGRTYLSVREYREYLLVLESGDLAIVFRFDDSDQIVESYITWHPLSF